MPPMAFSRRASRSPKRSTGYAQNCPPWTPPRSSMRPPFPRRDAMAAPPPWASRDCPVFQVALSTARRKDWDLADRGLSPADLAMHVVLPRGRRSAVLPCVVSFKSPTKRDPRSGNIPVSPTAPIRSGWRLALDRIEAHLRLARQTPADKRLALVLSTYPGRDLQPRSRGWGLDALASTSEISARPCDRGLWRHRRGRPWRAPLGWDADMAALGLSSQRSPTCPPACARNLNAAWGRARAGPRDQGRPRALSRAACGQGTDRAATRTGRRAIPRWRLSRPRTARRAMAMSPSISGSKGKRMCWCMWGPMAHWSGCRAGGGTLGAMLVPEVLAGDLPVIYPFIVNDPGEAAQAKRRIGAITLGHMPPPLAQTKLLDGMTRLESLAGWIFHSRRGWDPARRDRLIADIRAEAQGTGVEEDSEASPADASAAEAITRIDRFVCDIKESQYGEGLHIFGQGRSRSAAELRGVLDALAGKLVSPGPSGSPYRGRSDVMPTGRNLFTTRSSRGAVAGRRRRKGSSWRKSCCASPTCRTMATGRVGWCGWISGGSATMRTAGEEFAMALASCGFLPHNGTQDQSGFRALRSSRWPFWGVRASTWRFGCLACFATCFPGLPDGSKPPPPRWVPAKKIQATTPTSRLRRASLAPNPDYTALAWPSILMITPKRPARAAGEAWLAASSHAITSLLLLSKPRPKSLLYSFEKLQVFERGRGRKGEKERKRARYSHIISQKQQTTTTTTKNNNW